MYPEYKMEVFDHVQGRWTDTSYEASNRPHHYDFLYEKFNRLVAGAKQGSPRQKAIGYRIVVGGNTVVDSWTNGKIA